MTDIDARDELVPWLHEQIKHDEWVADHARKAIERDGEPWILIKISSQLDARVDDHIELFDPQRMLAEVESKRRIIAEHPSFESPGFGLMCQTCDFTGELYPCPTILAMAPPYAGREGYREEWRP